MSDEDLLYRDDNFEYEEQSEDAEDYKLTAEDFQDLLISPADWTVSTIRNQIQKSIDLDPEFQRRGVWNKKAKSRFIESLMLGIPIPQILLSDEKEKKNMFIVLDGKQRLLSIKEFFEGKYDDGTSFKLTELENLKDLNGSSWKDLQKDSDYAQALENSTIRTAVVKGWKNDAVLYEIFFRLNSGSVKLSPMELRMALYRGPFLRKIIKWTEQLNEVHSLLRLRRPDKRMADVELTARHLAFARRNIVYRGNLKQFLDDYCKFENANYDERELDKRLRNFLEAISAARKVFGEKSVCRKWLPREKRFDGRFNRALFDVIIGSFANEAFREWALNDGNAVVESFINVCEDSPDFVSSVESTTKSIGATNSRFRIWYERIFDLTNIPIEMPNIANADGH